MPAMQTVNRIIATSTHPVYVVDWNRPPEYGAPQSLPPPVKEWLENKCPEVKVGLLDCLQVPEPEASIRGSREERITASVLSSDSTPNRPMPSLPIARARKAGRRNPPASTLSAAPPSILAR